MIAEPGSAMIVEPASHLAVPPNNRRHNPLVTGLLFKNLHPVPHLQHVLYNDLIYLDINKSIFLCLLSLLEQFLYFYSHIISKKALDS